MNQQIEVTKETAEALQASGVTVRYVISVADIAVNREEAPRRQRAAHRQPAADEKFRLAKGEFSFLSDSIAETALFYAKGLFSLNDRFTRTEMIEALQGQLSGRYNRQQLHSVVHYLIKHHALIPAEGAIQRKAVA